MKIKLLILSLLFCFSLSGQKMYNYDLTVKSGKTIIKTRPTPLYYEKDGVKISTATILGKELDFKVNKTITEKADSVLNKVIQSNYVPHLDAEITLDIAVTNITVKGRNKAIQDAEKLAGVLYPMHFAWIDGAANIKGVVKFKDDNINKVYVVKETYENPVIQFILEHKIASGTRPYYTRKDGFIYVYMDGFSGSGTSGDPYQITTWAELADMNNHLSSYFILMNNLSSATTGYDTYASSSANSGGGWLRIGSVTPWFTGNFDGQGKTISDIYISSTTSAGLFGRIETGGIIKNVKVGDITIAAVGNYSGAISGLNNGTIQNCYVTGSINASSQGATGGIVGYNQGSGVIQNCYSHVNITNGIYSAGFVCYDIGIVTNCYSTGSISGTGSNGFSYTEGTGTNCFWDTETSGKSTSVGGTGKTTAEMKTLSTFTNWDIVSKASWVNEAWYIDATVDYPRLGWEHEPAPSSNIKSILQVLKANVKLFNGVTKANMKLFNGVQ
jgi:hypothetical protein